MKKAWTVSELLGVIASIASLAAMLMPALTKARGEALKAVCQANVHNLGLGWAMMRKDYNGEWTREVCQGWSMNPESLADIGGLGYIKDESVYLCPSLDSPFRRNPSLIYWCPGDGVDTADVVRFTGEIAETTYFADEARVAKEPHESRAILADGIEMLTAYGVEPANHADAAGRVEGSNVLFVDMAVEWTPVFRKEHPWTLASPSTARGVWPSEPNTFGHTDGNNWYPHPSAGSWKRYGYVQNLRLLRRDPGDTTPGAGAGRGEDDVENENDNDVDDIYYADCTEERYGGAAAWAFVEFARGGRCRHLSSKSKIDCSLVGGHIWEWRRTDAQGNFPGTYSGSGMWGWPEEVVP